MINRRNRRTRNSILNRRTAITIGATALITATLINATAATAERPAGVVVLDTTGSLMTSTGMITGDLTVKVTGRQVTAQYRDAAEWYPVTTCPTEDSASCVWINPTTDAIVINSRAS